MTTHEYGLLLAHIKDKCVMKHTIENEVVDMEAKWPVEDEGPMTGVEKVEHFYDRMKETHPEGLVTTATWSNVEREGMLGLHPRLLSDLRWQP